MQTDGFSFLYERTSASRQRSAARKILSSMLSNNLNFFDKKIRKDFVMLCKIIKINDKNVLAVVFVQNACYEGAALIFMILPIGYQSGTSHNILMER